MNDKKLTDSQLLGTQGTGLIELIVSRMGLVWRPTTQHDAGIDGEIEIRDATTGRMTGMLIKVQSKAVSALPNENNESFDYWPDARDMAYWLRHTVPVILIVSRPSTNECYWQVIQPSPPGDEKRMRFVKARDALNEDSRGRLIDVAQAASPRGVAPALSKRETLVSNLVPVTKLPERLYLAETSYQTAKDLASTLREAHLRLEFVLKNGRILTVRDLTDPRYQNVCDRGTVEDFDVKEWAESTDQDKQRDFVNLMNSCLREKLRSMPEALRFDRDTKCFFFPPSESNTPYDYAYRGDKKATAREVFKERRNKQQRHLMGFRHSAMKAQFYRFGDDWYLEVTPTYFFTKNGREQSKWHEEWLKGIKELEKNGAIRGQLMMWVDILRNPPGLFDEGYPFLDFGPPAVFSIDRGIDDNAWTSSDSSDNQQGDTTSAPLFELG
ncbi:DUF4365 domain-containing protein [Ralstonia pickettii]|uniref:DUF4365 domain-containing protein n=1 Tax=Ralstonia pickettii TaxID=329 RepID=UPI0015FE3D63|nr:DUF4365 domain-containing protein [Ralstonia pickettii]MBB0026130.1 DUF4365 domain-containing protein [Ralstonia pickettii]MBB0036813.1 DUF4365 domain-containing protein [Ralstonia pickettii]MBB0099353.1 DUF4365 domain-containing protein [Ralstonia pickettii]MBB0109148.1 DUF4365 domain-containing protein [Ralstonia pickettii]MBB0130127.1 DUF4365 domain-containing protein [Ralstonia pickettii]